MSDQPIASSEARGYEAVISLPITSSEARGQESMIGPPIASMHEAKMQKFFQ